MHAYSPVALRSELQQVQLHCGSGANGSKDCRSSMTNLESYTAIFAIASRSSPKHRAQRASSANLKLARAAVEIVMQLADGAHTKSAEVTPDAVDKVAE